jgi:hypothetical protein
LSETTEAARSSYAASRMPGPLVPDNPVWRQLYGALAGLAWSCGAAFAFVIDGGKGLWCIAPAALADSEPTIGTLRRIAHEGDAIDRFHTVEMVPRIAGMRRGRRLDVAKFDGEDRYVATSFATIYALVVWLERVRDPLGPAVDPALVPGIVRRALPKIEALTLALPPSGGPGTDEGAQKIRA